MEPSSVVSSSTQASTHSNALRSMLETLQQQEDERRRRAGPLAAFLLRACAGLSKVRERAQVTVHEALRQAKAVNSMCAPCPSHRQEGNTDQENESLEEISNGLTSANQLIATGSNSRDVTQGGGGEDASVWFPQDDEAIDCARPMSKSERLRADLLYTVFQATRYHMEPRWAAVELLDLVEKNLNPHGAMQRASQAVLDAIRVLPGLVAGDLLVTGAARGDISVILFYFDQGLSINHAHTSLKYQALHAASEFGHLDSVRLLVAMGAQVDARGGAEDRSPLFLAALAKRWDVCTWLLSVGASKILRDSQGLTAYQAVAGSSDPEVAGRAGMLTDPPQRVVSVTCQAISHNSLTIVWSDPLRSYNGETFVGFLVEWRSMGSRPIYSVHSKYVAERERPSINSKKGQQGWTGTLARPSTAGEIPSAPKTVTGLRADKSNSPQRPNTSGGETLVNANGEGEAQPWKGREVERWPLQIKGLHPATNYMVRVSARTLAGYGPSSREALLRTRISPPSAPPRAPYMVSATPSSITIGWVPPKYENGEPIVRYEIRRLILDKHHPDWSAGQGSGSQESENDSTSTISQTTDADATSITGDTFSSTDVDTGSIANRPKTTTTIATITTITTTTTATNTVTAADTEKNQRRSQGDDAATETVNQTTTCSAVATVPLARLPNREANLLATPELGAGTGGETGAEVMGVEGEVGGPAVKAAAAVAMAVVAEASSQIGLWTGQRTEKMTPYFTSSGLPIYCRTKFRIRAGNAAGWGPFSPISDPLEAQDIIVPIKRGPKHILVRWFNKPDGDILLWELSRRTFKYGVDFRGDEDDSWILCAADIPGLKCGESTFRCKDLMPGTEYQFRLRAFSNGSWQACEEAIVSSPFRTVCAPPDPPPTFPTFCQLESDPLVAGGLLDTGALLARRPDETLGRSRGNISSTDKLKDESVAEKEKPLSNKKKSPGRNRAASLTRDMEATGIVVAGETQQGRRGLEGNVKTRSRDWDHKESGLQLLSARDQGGKGREGSAVGHQGEGTEEASSSRAGSTSIVLQWEAGCPNGAIVMNYEVWGMADTLEGEAKSSSSSGGSGEWRLAVTTEAAPTVTLSGLKQEQPYRFKVRAQNALGWSDFGPATPPIVINPLRPCQAPELEDRGITWLALRLRAPPGSGLLVGFELQMCHWVPGMWAGDETWGPLVVGISSKVDGKGRDCTIVNTTQEDRIVVWDLRPGAGYRFKARARTVFGWTPGGAPSDIYTTARRF